MEHTIDLAKKGEYLGTPEMERDGKVWYPSLYLADADIPKLGQGDKYAKIKYCLKRNTESYEDGEVSREVELDVKEITFYVEEEPVVTISSGDAIEERIAQDMESQ